MHSELSRLKHQKDGVRCDFKYTIDDGRVYKIKGLSFSDESQALVSLASRENEAIQIYQDIDAQDAVDLEIEESYKTASIEKVWFTYLCDGFNASNAVTSYNEMSKVAPQLLAMGLSIEDMADLFNEEVEVATEVFERWTYLDSNKEAILAYEEIKL